MPLHPARELPRLSADPEIDGGAHGVRFPVKEICRTHDLEALVRQANVMAGCRSFDDVVRAIRAMQTLG